MTAGRAGILIVGKNGQLARTLYDLLKASGEGVTTISRPEFDLCGPETVRSGIRNARPAIVVNCAAYTAVDRAEDEPGAAFDVNATGAEVVARAAAEIGAPVIHISTDYVFDGESRRPYVETDIASPLSVYGRSKLAGETAVAGANPKHVILRTAWLFSPFGSNFVKTMLRLNSERPQINVVDDQFGNPTSATDLARVVTSIIEVFRDGSANESHFGTFHAVNSGSTTWFGFAKTILESASRRGVPRAELKAIAAKDYPVKARRPANSVLSTEKLSHVYGIVLRPWPEALSDCLDQLIGPVRNTATAANPQSLE